MEDDDRWVNTPYGKMRRDDWIDMQFRRADERRRDRTAGWLKFAKESAASEPSDALADRGSTAAHAFLLAVAGVNPLTGATPASRRRGRPKGRKYSRQQVIERFAAHAERLGRKPTQEEFADDLDIGRRTLQGYLADYGLPWPVE